jgi:hypothetical protein
MSLRIAESIGGHAAGVTVSCVASTVLVEDGALVAVEVGFVAVEDGSTPLLVQDPSPNEMTMTTMEAINK